MRGAGRHLAAAASAQPSAWRPPARLRPLVAATPTPPQLLLVPLPLRRAGASAAPEGLAAPPGRGQGPEPVPLRALRADLAALRADRPAFLLELGELAPAPLVADAAGELRAPRLEQGPWDVCVTVAGSDGDAALAEPLRLRLRFGAEWPREPPAVRYGGLVQHPAIDAQRGPPEGFYTWLRNTAGGGALSLPDILRRARLFFLDPLEVLDLSDAEDRRGVLQRMRSALAAAREANGQRLSVIRQYAPLARHPELFDAGTPLQPRWFAPQFWAASQQGTPEAWRALLSEHQQGEVYSMPLFSEEFCDTLLDEVFSFYGTGLPAKRPNSMNNYGIVLDDIGLGCLVNKLQAVLQPVGRALFPGPGSAWDSHHCFIVRYRQGEDLGLDMHTDDSDVTFNICLGLSFSGAGLQFCGRVGWPEHRRYSFTYQHEKGRCLVHLGSKRHGADDISAGERLNLILWNHSFDYRASRAFQQPPYYKEAGPPDAVCVSYTHDRDCGVFKPYPSAYERFRGQGWCPPPKAEYDGFKPEVS